MIFARDRSATFHKVSQLRKVLWCVRLTHPGGFYTRRHISPASGGAVDLQQCVLKLFWPRNRLSEAAGESALDQASTIAGDAKRIRALL
jgi:hypothetical protein